MRLGVVILAAIIMSSAQAQVLNCEDGYFKNIAFGTIKGRFGLVDKVLMPPVEGLADIRLARYPSGTSYFQSPISGIQILDQIGDGTGGCAKIVVGGIGSNFVLVQYKSHVGKAVDYNVAIYLML